MNCSRPYLFRLLCVSVLLLGSAGTPTPASAQMQRAGGNPFKPPQAKPQYARSRDYDVRHLSLVFDIDAAQRSAKGVVTHYLAPLRDGLQSLVMDAGDNLKIESCRINGEEKHFTHEKETLTVSPGMSLPKGKELALEIHYAMPGGVRNGGANGAGGFHWINPRAADADSRPVRRGADAPVPDPKNPPMPIGFWTQGETLGNHSWVPCYDYPNDMCTSEVVVTVPEQWEAIGNGSQGATTRNTTNHTRTFHWTMKQPHSTYLLSLAGGELEIRKSAWRGVPLYYVVPKGKADLIPGSFEDTPRMLEFFSNIVGVKYPWPKYAQNAMYDFGGGMENVSATTLGAGSLTDKRSGYYPMAGLNSHELAHQWFGDLVTCESWGDVWLNESFATFFEQLYMEHSRGKDAYDQDRDGSLRSYLNESRRYKRPLSTRLYSHPDVMFDSHTYPKGALILHQLRRILGDTDFFKGLNFYLTLHRHQPVNAHDLCNAFTRATGQNVEMYFDQWIFKPGHPVLTMQWSYDEATHNVVVKVKQTQDTADGTPIYNTPLTFGLLRNTTSNAVERQAVTLNQAEQEFRFAAPTKPDVVLLDPDHDLLKEYKDPEWTEAEMATILRYAPTVMDKLRAVRGYARAGEGLNDAKIQVLAEALKAETSEDVASAIMGLISDEKREALRPLFRQQAQNKEQQVRRTAALNALAKLPKTNEDLALCRAAAQSDTEQYRTVEAALNALAHFGVGENLEVLRHQLASHSLNNRLANKAVNILKESKLEAAAPLLLEATKPERPLSVRRNAIEALAEVALNNATVRTALLALLKEDNPRLQKTVISALKDRKEKEAIPALRALTSTDKEVMDEAKAAADTLEK